MARRSRFDETTARRICRRLAEGETLVAICRQAGMPARRTVYDWLDAHAAFRGLYREARQQQLESWAEEIVALADGLGAEEDRDAVARVKLRIEVRQWLIARLAGRGGEPEEASREKERRPLVIEVVTGISRPGDRPAGCLPEDRAAAARDGNGE
jgi:hypothetical protein